MSQNSVPIAYLPGHLDRLLDRPWHPAASAAIDRHLWRCELEQIPSAKGVRS